MSRVRSPRARATALSVVAVTCFAAGIPLTVLSGQLGDGVIATVIGLPSALVGVLVTRRQPRNPLGWVFLVTGILLALSTLGDDWAALIYLRGHRLPLGTSALALDGLWTLGLTLFALPVLLFPDARLPSRFWRGLFVLYGLVYAALLVAVVGATIQALATRPLRVDSTGGLQAVDNPSGWSGAVHNVVGPIVVILVLAFIARQALSWRRAAGDRRQQLKWLASGAVVTFVCLVLASVYSTPGHPHTVLQAIGSLAWLGVAALPVAMGVAILRYRLYDIDRIVSRTLAYVIVTGLLVGVYAGLVLLATQVLRFSSPVAVAAATLAAAALFNPLRRRVQHAVDRRFNRARYDADQMITAFAARLQDTVDPEAVRTDLTAAAKTALEPTHVSVWLSR